MVEEWGEPLVMSESVFDFLRAFGWTQMPKDRHVALAFDTAAIDDVLPYRDGSSSTRVLLFAVKVINKNGFQPIGNVFFSDDTPPWKIASCIRAYVRDLECCEMFVVATVCPPTEYLRRVVENLIEGTNLRNKTDAHVYNADNMKDIVHIYDVPSMLREMRDRFARSQVTFERFGVRYTADYKDVERVLRRSSKPYLTAIVQPTDDDDDADKCAVRLFSATMARTLREAASKDGGRTRRGSGNLCAFFGALFDSFSGRPGHDNPYRMPLSSTSFHHQTWNEAVPVLRSMQFLPKESSSLQKYRASSDVATGASAKPEVQPEIKSQRVREGNSSHVRKMKGDARVKRPGETKALVNESQLQASSSSAVPDRGGSSIAPRVTRGEAEVETDTSENLSGTWQQRQLKKKKQPKPNFNDTSERDRLCEALASLSSEILNADVNEGSLNKMRGDNSTSNAEGSSSGRKRTEGAANAKGSSTTAAAKSEPRNFNDDTREKSPAACAAETNPNRTGYYATLEEFSKWVSKCNISLREKHALQKGEGKGDDAGSAMLALDGEKRSSFKASSALDLIEEEEEEGEAAGGVAAGDDLGGRPYVLDAWIISINGMRVLYEKLRRKRLESINTKVFNVDCVRYMFHKVRQANGLERRHLVDRGFGAFLDEASVQCAFVPDANITL